MPTQKFPELSTFEISTGHIMLHSTIAAMKLVKLQLYCWHVVYCG